MKRFSRPQVLVVDDEADDQRAFGRELGEEVQFSAMHPQHVREDDIGEADVIIVDLRLENWLERDELQPLSLKPPTGLALISTLQEHRHRIGSQRPAAFAIRTGHLSDLARALPLRGNEHMIARAHNLDWVFSKSSSSGISAATQVRALAQAVYGLPTSWPADDQMATRDTVTSLLALPPDTTWELRAWRDIELCHPPVHELSTHTHGIAFLRWLLHRIFPYPCFLWDMHHLAARLRVTPASLREELAQRGRLYDLLVPAQYKGTLGGFSGPRWWRSGIESLLWDLTDGDAFDGVRLATELTSRSNGRILRVTLAQPVVCTDVNYAPQEDLVDAADAVRLQPDGWPIFADVPWASVSQVREDRWLSSIVVDQDRARVEQEEDK